MAWRVPFALGLLIAPFGIYLRRRLADDNLGAEHHGLSRRMLRELFIGHLRTLLLIALTVMGGTVSIYILNFYMPTYAIHTPGLPMSLSMLLCCSMGSASEFALMCESFPRRVRATGISIAYALAVCVFGGTAQRVATWLIRVTGSKLAPAGYVTLCVLASLVAVSLLRETAKGATD